MLFRSKKKEEISSEQESMFQKNRKLLMQAIDKNNNGIPDILENYPRQVEELRQNLKKSINIDR